MVHTLNKLSAAVHRLEDDSATTGFASRNAKCCITTHWQAQTPEQNRRTKAFFYTYSHVLEMSSPGWFMRVNDYDNEQARALDAIRPSAHLTETSLSLNKLQ